MSSRQSQPPISAIRPARKSRTIIVTGVVTAIVVTGVYAGASLRTSYQQRKALEARKKATALASNLSSAVANEDGREPVDFAEHERKRREADRRVRSELRQKQIVSLKTQREVWDRELADINRKRERLSERMARDARGAAEEQATMAADKSVGSSDG